MLFICCVYLVLSILWAGYETKQRDYLLRLEPRHWETSEQSCVIGKQEAEGQALYAIQLRTRQPFFMEIIFFEIWKSLALDNWPDSKKDAASFVSAFQWLLYTASAMCLSSQLIPSQSCSKDNSLSLYGKHSTRGNGTINNSSTKLPLLRLLKAMRLAHMETEMNWKHHVTTFRKHIHVNYYYLCWAF